MIFLASNGVEAVRTALNRAYRVSETRSFVFLRAQSVVFVLVGAVASLSFAFLGLFGPTLFEWVAYYAPAIKPFATTFNLFRIGITAVVVVAVLVAAHLWLPASRPPVMRLWPGIVATLVLWLIAAWGLWRLPRPLRQLRHLLRRPRQRLHCDRLPLPHRDHHDLRRRAQRRPGARATADLTSPIATTASVPPRG